MNRHPLGDMYEGNHQYLGTGTSRWCALCGTHKPSGGGRLIDYMGGRHWVCKNHPKPLTAKELKAQNAQKRAA